MQDSPNILNYGQGPRSKKKLYLRVFTILILALALLPVGFRIGGFLDRIAAEHRFLAAQQRARDQTMPSDLVCFSDDPRLADLLASDSSYFRGSALAGVQNQFLHIGDPAIAALNRAEIECYSNGGLLLPTGETPLFLHGRRSPAGHERLVAISLWSAGDGPGNDGVYIYLSAQIFTLGTVTTSPASLILNGHGLSLHRRSYLQALTLYAGQVDPLDGSHLTIPFEFRGQRHVIDGFLHDDDTLPLDPHLGHIATANWDPYLQNVDIDGE